MARRGGGPSVEMPPEDDLEAGQPGAEPGLSRIILLAKAEAGWLLLGTVFLFLALVPMLAMPLYFSKVVEDIVMDKPADERKAAVGKHLLELVLLLLMGALTTTFRAFIFNGAGERVVARLRIQLFRAIIIQDIGMFDKRKTGELLSRLSADTTSLQDVATVNISMFLRGLAQVFFSVALMFYTSWQLATLIVLVVPLCVGAMAGYGRILRRLSTLYSDALGRSSDVAQQSVANVRTVRSFAAEELESLKYEQAVGNPDDPSQRKCCWSMKTESSYSTGIKRAIAGAIFQGFVTLVGLGAIVGVIWFGALQVIDGHLTQGNLVAFIMYAVQIGASLGMMAGLMASIFTAKGASKRTFQLIDREPQVPVRGGIEPEQMVGVIDFEKVSFVYPSRPDVHVLRDFSLNIPKDATVAFVGSSGAGKSTVLSLIQRFYDVTGGRILIDGKPLTDLDPSWLRRHFAYVQQEPALFGATIAHNIAYGYAVLKGSPDAMPDQAELEKAAKDAYAHDFIMSFPQGYETIVGERGVRLSGGQKQRIAIARALLMDPRVLLLDEATSALDAESESIVARAIEKAMVGRTTLIVAHRLSTVQNADQIVVVDKGSIVDIGTHSDLLERCAKYQELVRRQLQGGGSLAESEDMTPRQPEPFSVEDTSTATSAGKEDFSTRSRQPLLGQAR
eukprot:TRINITY_DN63013_c0_g1_i1.p1 TRINITY_DN63013_c0_g1~~TRINITY_DN63013_c0_g1_i1.p1  ORF type:complete len:726 (+),score=153.96 TRINITY_DN63013_c0_g1_i1:153-2180(+)